MNIDDILTKERIAELFESGFFVLPDGFDEMAAIFAKKLAQSIDDDILKFYQEQYKTNNEVK